MAARLAPQKSCPDGTANPALEGDAPSKPTPQHGPACTELWTTRKSSLQPNRKRCWSTALQKFLLQSFTVETQRVGRARSACAGRAAIRTPGKVRRAEDCPPYQSGCDGACPLMGAVNSASEGGAFPKLAAVRGSVCAKLWTTWEPPIQSNQKWYGGTARQCTLHFAACLQNIH